MTTTYPAIHEAATAGPAASWPTLALQCLPHGVAVLDQHSRVRFSNRAARSAINRAGWRLDGEKGDQLCCALAADREVWTQALLGTCLHQRHALVELKAVGAASAVFVSLAPLKWSDTNMALASFERDELCGPLVLEQFAARHGLSIAERLVLQRLCEGLRSAAIARAHGVKLTTVLTQVASIRLKTQRESVQALMHTLSRLPGVRATYEAV